MLYQRLLMAVLRFSAVDFIGSFAALARFRFVAIPAFIFSLGF